eukprot:CAMPEP_0197529574 /NCGR_PEP_ID=MMETSP1318-20131121/28822_1 /TAXON_ID=552666 /ORGANISM="Partenskyella glossopodia, Strain RCC365" /LENGTH=259 /DNA_ID=CAMNT_0043085083 /DNA_START=74 /DNA_END=850 /DNA_ORIENTATION=-
MTKNHRVVQQQDQEMLQSTMFAILDSLFWGMIVGTGCLIMSYVLPLSEDSDNREMGTNLDIMANSLFWGATAGSGCLLALYTLIGALYPPAGDASGVGSWLEGSGSSHAGSSSNRKKGGDRDRDQKSRKGSKHNRHHHHHNSHNHITSSSNHGKNAQAQSPDKDAQRQGLEGRGDNDWLIMHMDRILVACCCIMNFPLFSWVLGQDVLWWGGLFAVILVTSFLDRSQYLERMPLQPVQANGSAGNSNGASNQGSGGGGR